MEIIRTLLQQCTLEAVAHRQPMMLLTVNESDQVLSGLKVLKDNDILSVAVVDAKGQFAGVLSSSDVLCGLVKGLHLDKERSSFDLSSELVTKKLQGLLDAQISHVMHTGDLWYIDGTKPTVLDAAKDMVLRTAVHHRIFTCESLKDTSPNGILTQMDVAGLIWNHKCELGDIMRCTARELGLTAAAANTVLASQSALQALVDLYRDRKTSVAVVSAGGKLLGSIAVSDLRRVTAEHAPLLQGPVGAFMLAIRGMPVPAAEAGDVDWEQALAPLNVPTVTPESTFQEVLGLMTSSRLHGVYVCDAVEGATGIITLTDILKMIVLPREHVAPDVGPAGGLPNSAEVEAAA